MLHVPPSLRAAFDDLEAEQRARNRRALRTPEELRRDDLVDAMAYAHGFGHAEARAALAQLEHGVGGAVPARPFLRTSKPLTLSLLRQAARELIRMSNPAARGSRRARRRQPR